MRKKPLKYKNTVELSMKRLKAQRSANNDLHREIVEEQRKHIENQK